MQVDVGNCVETEEDFWWSEPAILFVLVVFPLKMLHRRASIVLMSIIRKAAGLRKRYHIY